MTVPGLGKFTLSEHRTEMGTQGAKVELRPVFVLSERFAARNDVKARAEHVRGTTPVVPLNLSRIASASGWNKFEVEGCIREVLYAMSRDISNPRGIALELIGIGRLSIRRRKVRFNFYKHFESNPKPFIGRPPSRMQLSSRGRTAGSFGDEIGRAHV